MRFLFFLQTTLLSALLPNAASAFVAAPAFAGVKMNKAGLMPGAGPLFDKNQMADSSLDVHNLRTLIDNLKPDNYDASLSLMEPLLLNECVGQECEDYLAQLKDKCQEIGKPLPEGFAPTHH